MKHATNCQFCKVPITLEIDDDYAKLGDPQKLLAKRCCDRCADLRVEKRIVEEKIRAVCSGLFRSGAKAAKEIEPVVRKLLIIHTQRYARLISRWHHMDGMAWEEAVVDQLIERPDCWADTIGRLWKVFKATQETMAV